MSRELTYADIERAAEQRDPMLGELYVRYLEQPDPPEDRAEDAEDASATLLSPDVPTVAKLRAQLSPLLLARRAEDERKAVRDAAWAAIERAPHPPPRLASHALLESLYERGDERARSALMEVFLRARICWGFWRGFKRVYKRVEERHDAAMFGVMAFRLDTALASPRNPAEVSASTIAYLQRRAWRYLRQLGRAVPELYPMFAVEVLRHYPEPFSFADCWIANHVWAAQQLKYQRRAWMHAPPPDLAQRAFPESWKLAPEPLLRLLEDAQNDAVCGFAIRSLHADFPDALRRSDPAWLARLGRKPAGSVHELVVEILTSNPELHQSKLASLGLHEMVIGLLASPSARARAYAIEYAQAHAPRIEVGLLLDHASLGASRGQADVVAFVRARLEKADPRAVGLAAWARALAVAGLEPLAEQKLREGFTPADIDEAMFVALANGGRAQQSFIRAFFAEVRAPAGHLRAWIESGKLGHWQLKPVMDLLRDHYAPRDIGLDWIKQSLLDPARGGFIAEWLTRGKLAGDDLDVEWIKGLVMRPSLRAVAIQVLGNRALVAPSRIGLAWLLAMARQSDRALSELAQRMLLEHFAPADFAGEGADPAAGIAKLFALLSSDAEPVRHFAATYLRVHHPELGPQTSEARQYGVLPKLAHDTYALERVRPLLVSEHADVRRFACAIAKRELVRWGQGSLLYALAESRHREPRQLAADVFGQIGEPEADAATPPVEWLAAPRVLALAESAQRTAREIALMLIRKHYARLGGAERLAWLMESAEREVRLFAVRLLWQNHRPRATPPEWKPRKGEGAPRAGESFESQDELRIFLRTVLFGLPPGRMERRDLSALPDRSLSASIAKQRLIDVVRDLAVEDRAFAVLVVPVLEEMSASCAKGEWQRCVAALARVRRRHPTLHVSLPPPIPLATEGA